MVNIIVSASWRAVHSDARVGVLALHHVQNPSHHPVLDAESRRIEQALREQFAGQTRAELIALDTLRAYNAFYKRFGKTYHVQLQLESMVLKGKPLGSTSALVQAMFMAELRNQLLTAGHDLDYVTPPLTIAAARGDEAYTRLNGQPQTLKADDMFMTDAQGIISSVNYGPDQRTQIRPQTTRVQYVTYAPSGIGETVLRQHLLDMESYVRLVSPQAEREHLGICDNA
ncbi:MAG: hypothetical protein LC737_09290, partial [Chloroflexi bacterium]|nr:hypothetical protein [Chloroflexota bacterium]